MKKSVPLQTLHYSFLDELLFLKNHIPFCFLFLFRFYRFRSKGTLWKILSQRVAEKLHSTNTGRKFTVSNKINFGKTHRVRHYIIRIFTSKEATATMTQGLEQPIYVK